MRLHPFIYISNANPADTRVGRNGLSSFSTPFEIPLLRSVHPGWIFGPNKLLSQHTNRIRQHEYNLFLWGEDSVAKRNDISSLSSEASPNITSIIDNPQLLTAANVTSNGLLVHISFEWIVTMLIVVFGKLHISAEKSLVLANMTDCSKVLKASAQNYARMDSYVSP